MNYFASSLDPRLGPVEELVTFMADYVRPRSVSVEAGHAAPLERFPDEIVRAAVDLGMPPEYRHDPVQQLGLLTDAEQRVVVAFAGGYGDPAATLTLPGASLSGSAVEALGDRAQQDRFFGRWAEDPTTRSFFAVTEPRHGTNAHLLTSSLDLGAGVANGSKRFIGNLVEARVGVVFARIAPSPLGLRSFVLDLPRDGAAVLPLPMVGMRCAGLGELRLQDVRVPGDDVLGAHLPASRRGLWGMTRAFVRMRMQVAAMALGAGSAVLEGLNTDHDGDVLEAEGRALARLVWESVGAEGLVGKQAEGRSSLCKAACVDWATRVVLHGSRAWGSVQDPELVGKLMRDVVGMEFMEGTGPKQRQLLARDWLRAEGVKSIASVA